MSIIKKTLERQCRNFQRLFIKCYLVKHNFRTMPNAFSEHQFPDEKKHYFDKRFFFTLFMCFSASLVYNEQKKIYVVNRSCSKILLLLKIFLQESFLNHNWCTPTNSHLECLIELITLIIWRDGEVFFSLLNQHRDQRCGKNAETCLIMKAFCSRHCGAGSIFCVFTSSLQRSESKVRKLELIA